MTKQKLTRMFDYLSKKKEEVISTGFNTNESATTNSITYRITLDRKYRNIFKVPSVKTCRKDETKNVVYKFILKCKKTLQVYIVTTATFILTHLRCE